MRLDFRKFDPRNLSRQVRGLGTFAGSGGSNGNGVTTNPRFLPNGGQGGSPSDVDSEQSADSLNIETPSPSEHDKAICSLLQSRMRAAADARREHEDRYREGMAFYLGNQWCEWNGGVYNDLRRSTTDAPDRIYSVRNRIEFYADQLINRYLASSVSISVAPFSRRPADKASASQARSLNYHFDILLQEELSFLHDLRQVIACGPVFRYTYYDPNAVVPVPLFADDSDEIIDIEDAPAGEICEETISWEDIYPDPKGKYDLDECDWLIFARRRSLSYIRGKWPEKGWLVRAESSSIHDETKQRLEEVEGDTQSTHGSETARQYATVLTQWEQPSPGFPNGRYIVKAGEVILEEMDWPYTEMKHPTRSGRFEYPFTMLVYKPGFGALWGDNMVTTLKGAQRSVNRIRSKIDEHTRRGDGKLLVPEGSNVAVSSFRSETRDEKIPYTITTQNLGAKPEYIQLPGLDPANSELLDREEQFMEQASNIPPVSQGREPYAGAPFAAIQALQDAANQSAQVFNTLVKGYKLAIARKRLALAKQFYDFARFVYVQDTANEASVAAQMGAMMENGEQEHGGIPPEVLALLPPEVAAALSENGGMDKGAGAMPGQPSFDMEDEWESARTTAMAFDDFAKGRYTLTATLTPPKSPTARVAMILDMAKSGMFLPEALPVTIVMLQAMEIQESDKLTRDLLAVLQGMQKRQERMLMAPEQARADVQAQAEQERMAVEGERQQMEMTARSQEERDKQAAQAESEMLTSEQKHRQAMELATHTARVNLGADLVRQMNAPEPETESKKK